MDQMTMKKQTAMFLRFSVCLLATSSIDDWAEGELSPRLPGNPTAEE